MQNGKFVCFANMTAEQHQIFGANISPDAEKSLFKQVPVDRMEEFKQVARSVLPQARIRVRFRGPRHDCMRLTTLKRDARSVTIYADLP